MIPDRQGHTNTVWNDLEGTEEIWPYGGSNHWGVGSASPERGKYLAPAEPVARAHR